MTGARIGPWSPTASRRRFYPIDPRPEDFCIEDIAAGLSRECRWSGQVPGDGWISVAEHSILVASVVPHELAMAALLHDAQEAYLRDISRPTKRLLGDYMAIEDKVQKVILTKFGVEHWMMSAIKEADDAVAAAEAVHLFGHDGPDFIWEGRAPKPANVLIRMLPPASARNEFLRTFEMLARQGQPTLAELAAG